MNRISLVLQPYIFTILDKYYYMSIRRLGRLRNRGNVNCTHCINVSDTCPDAPNPGSAHWPI